VCSGREMTEIALYILFCLLSIVFLRKLSVSSNRNKHRNSVMFGIPVFVQQNVSLFKRISLAL
jgi:hypothetical protein